MSRLFSYRNRPAHLGPYPLEKLARHLKGFGYSCNAAMVGICEIPQQAWRDTPAKNPDVNRLAQHEKRRHIKIFAAGVDVIIAGPHDSLSRPFGPCRDHSHALVFLYDFPRDPGPDEVGAEWIQGAQAHRACLRGAETAVAAGP